MEGRRPVAGRCRNLRASWVQKFRNSYGYQRFIQFFKWNVLPNLVVAPLLLLLGFWVVLGAYAQTMLPFLENGARLCTPSPADMADITTRGPRFPHAGRLQQELWRCREGPALCRDLRCRRPVVRQHVRDKPGRNSGGRLRLWGWDISATPFKRVIDANYLQPIREISPINGRNKRWFGRNTQIYPIPVRAVGDSVTLYRAEFIAERSGELFLFANDAMIPLRSSVWGAYDHRFFYESSGLGPRGAAWQSRKRLRYRGARKRRPEPTRGAACRVYLRSGRHAERGRRKSESRRGSGRPRQIALSTPNRGDTMALYAFDGTGQKDDNPKPRTPRTRTCRGSFWPTALPTM